MLLTLEIVCLTIVASYVVARLLQASGGGQRRAFLGRFAVLAVASFLGEDSVIRAYGFYAYATGWSARLDHVPLVIVLVWPVVIDSAATLARALVTPIGGGKKHPSLSDSVRVATLGAAIVLADASLIEPIAVRAGLWRWIEPGLFGVPLIGILGWAFFAWTTIMVFELARGPALAIVLAVAPIVTHALIIVSWWALFRWISGERSAVAAAGLAWGAAIVVATRTARDALAGRGLAVVPIGELLVRLPGALFFFVLLGMTAYAPSVFASPDARVYAAPDAGLLALAAYAAAFAPPYLTALSLRAASRRSNVLA